MKTLVKFSETAEAHNTQEDYLDGFGWAVGLKVTMGGRITANIGTEYTGTTLLNCFINGPVSNAFISYTRKIPTIGDMKVVRQTQKTPDSLSNIMLTLLEQAETLKSEGGWGMNFDFIRPRSSLIKGVGIRHPGVIAYMELFDKSSDIIVKGDNDGYKDTLEYSYISDNLIRTANEKKKPRKGAMMGVLSSNHPDISEFVTAKQTPGKLTKFNISILTDEEFMTAVDNDTDYQLWFPDENGNKVTYKTVRAVDLYDLIMTSTYNRAEPGVLFGDNMQKNNPLAYLGDLNATNPCGEIGGNPATSTVCLLLSLNLTMYINSKKIFNVELYTSDLATAARMADNINDLTTAPLTQYTWASKNIRQYGMGVNGMGSALYMLGVGYADKEAMAFAELVTSLKEEITWKVSAELAAEKGVFPAYDKEGFEGTHWFTNFTKITENTKNLIRKNGVRNGKTTTQPPLGNSSVICDMVSNGLEPVFMKEYQRTYIADSWPVGLEVGNVKTVLKPTKAGDADVWQGEFAGKTYYYEPHNRGLCIIEPVRDYGYQWVLENYPEEVDAAYLVTTESLTVDNHMDVQEIFQRNCNQSISKTANLPAGYSFDDFKQLYLKAWKKGLNGFTTYVSGSMESVLSAIEEKAVKGEREIIKSNLKLPDTFVNGDTNIIYKEGQKFYFHFSYLPEDTEKVFPVVIWINTNSTGEIREANGAVKKLGELLLKFEIEEVLISVQREKIKGDSGVTRVSKMISMCLRHNIPIVSIVAALDTLEEVYVTDTIFAVKKFLSEQIVDGEAVLGAVCSACKGTHVVYESGCSLCKDCGNTNCA